MLKRIMIVSILFCLGNIFAGNIKIVKNGEPEMSIVVSETAVEPVKEAADELQKYIEKTTGAKLPIVNKAAGKAIYVGESDYTQKLGLTNDSFKKQEYLIKANDGNLILMGRDESNRDNAKLIGHSFNSKRFFQATGTLYAVDDFLEKFCGVRWYMIGDLGEVIQPTQTLKIPSDTNIRRMPCTKFRSLFALNNIPKSLHYWNYKQPKKRPESTIPFKDVFAWGRRMKVGGLAFAANHNQGNYRTRFANKKEWFANHSNRIGNQLCYSNPQVLAQVVSDARSFFNGSADLKLGRSNIGNYFSVMPQDTEAWCTCPKCEAQYKPKTEKKFHNGSKSYYVWNFVNKVAKEVKKTNPGKYIGCCAYWDYRDCPESMEIEDNVAVLFTKSYAGFGNRKSYNDAWGQIAKWQKKVKELYFWDYYLFPCLQAMDRFPNISPYLVAEEIGRMKKFDIRGGMMAQLDEWFWRSPAMDHLRVYVTMKLLDNWNLDINQLMNEYFRLFYGPAEKPMKKYWLLLDKIYRRKSISQEGAEIDWTVICPESDIRKLSNFLEEAGKAVLPESIYAKRVTLIKDSIQDVLETSSKRVLKIMNSKKSLNALKIDRPPVMDGTLNDPVWKKAQAADKWMSINGDKPYVKSKAYVLYDDENIYVGYECFDAKNYNPDQKFKHHDGQVYRDDSVELFIVPESNPQKIIQICANCIGVVFDALNRNSKWNSDAVVKTKITPGYWTVTMQIPLKALSGKKIQKGDQWLVNFCRNRRNQPGFISEFTNWNGPGGYHNSKRFGILNFK